MIGWNPFAMQKKVTNRCTSTGYLLQIVLLQSEDAQTRSLDLSQAQSINESKVGGMAGLPYYIVSFYLRIPENCSRAHGVAGALPISYTRVEALQTRPNNKSWKRQLHAVITVPLVQARRVNSSSMHLWKHCERGPQQELKAATACRDHRFPRSNETSQEDGILHPLHTCGSKLEEAQQQKWRARPYMAVIVPPIQARRVKEDRALQFHGHVIRLAGE